MPDSVLGSRFGQTCQVLNPIALSSQLLDELRMLSQAVQSLPEIERKLDARLARVEAQLDALPVTIERLYPELVGSREAAQMVPSLIEAVRLDVERIFAELVEVRQTVEPLQGPAERLERMSDRLPGGG